MARRRIGSDRNAASISGIIVGFLSVLFLPGCNDESPCFRPAGCGFVDLSANETWQPGKTGRLDFDAGGPHDSAGASILAARLPNSVGIKGEFFCRVDRVESGAPAVMSLDGELGSLNECETTRRQRLNPKLAGKALFEVKDKDGNPIDRITIAIAEVAAVTLTTTDLHLEAQSDTGHNVCPILRDATGAPLSGDFSADWIAIDPEIVSVSSDPRWFSDYVGCANIYGAAVGQTDVVVTVPALQLEASMSVTVAPSQ